MYKCHLCQNELKTKAALSTHYKKVEKLDPLTQAASVAEVVYGKKVVNDLIEDYKKGLYSIYTLKQKGYDLNKYFSLLGIKRTSSEERATPRYKDTYKQSILAKYGVENISQAPSVKESKRQTIINNYGSEKDYYNYTHSNLKKGYEQYIASGMHLETTLKMKKTFQAKYNAPNPSQVPSILLKIKESNKVRLNNLSLEEKRAMTSKAREAVSNRGGFSSKLEKRVWSVLDALGIVYSRNTNLFGYNFDIVFGDIIVEINGTYWHAKPSKYSEEFLIMNGLKAKDVWEKDLRKQTIAIENGYKVYVLWEDSLNKMSDTDLTNWLQNIQEIEYDRKNYQY